MELSIEGKIKQFEVKHNCLMPEDLKAYFKSFDKDTYDRGMFNFYDFNEFKSVYDEVGDYFGSPDYLNIVNTLPEHKQCFVFAEFFTHAHVYAIRLFKNQNVTNEVYVICGDAFKQVAGSFTEFIAFYKNDEEVIYI